MSDAPAPAFIPKSQFWRIAFVVLGAVVLHAVLTSLLPRFHYEHVSAGYYLKIDNWTGRAQIVAFSAPARQ